MFHEFPSSHQFSSPPTYNEINEPAENGPTCPINFINFRNVSKAGRLSRINLLDKKKKEKISFVAGQFVDRTKAVLVTEWFYLATIINPHPQLDYWTLRIHLSCVSRYVIA